MRAAVRAKATSASACAIACVVVVVGVVAGAVACIVANRRAIALRRRRREGFASSSSGDRKTCEASLALARATRALYEELDAQDLGTKRGEAELTSLNARVAALSCDEPSKRAAVTRDAIGVYNFLADHANTVARTLQDPERLEKKRQVRENERKAVAELTDGGGGDAYEAQLEKKKREEAARKDA